MRRGTASGVLVAVLAMAVAAAACRGNADEAERVPIEDRPPAGPEPDDESSADTRSAAARSFALGVEYTEVGLAWPYAEVGVEWAKTRLEAFTWGAIEPEAPEGTTHSYDWSCADALVRDWQQAGVVHLQSYLSPEADWAVDPDRHPAPRTEHLDDYRAFVTAIVERYDGDGTDDMPGLVAPVRHWVIGGEWTGFWRSDDADAYLEVLAATREAAHAASEDVVLGTIPFLLYDVFEGNPTDAEVEARLVDPGPAFRNSTAGMRRILDHPELFDYVDVHSLGDATELPPLFEWFRAEMSARGYDRPLWVDDAFPTGFLVNEPLPGTGWPLVHPVHEDQRDAVHDLLVAAARDRDEEAQAWVRRLAAIGTVRKGITALAVGARGINIGNTEDWMPDALPGLRRLQVDLVGAAAMFGMVDVTHPEGLGLCAPRRPGSARPALGALALLREHVGGGAVSAEPIGELPDDVVGHRLDGDGPPSWVLWLDDGTLRLPGDPQPGSRVALRVPDEIERLAITWTPTGPGTAVPERRNLDVEGGVAEVTVGPVPVFLDPA